MTFPVSPSSLSTYALCARKWAFSAIDRIPRVQHESAALGERVHAIVEAWLQDGKAPDLGTVEGMIASKALKYLPKPMEASVEWEFSFVAGDGLLLFNGRIDAITDDCVYDLKTTGDMRWAKTSEDLHTDEQAVVYSKAFMTERLTALPPALRWVYTKTKGAGGARKVDATLSELEVAEGMAKLEKRGLEMYRAKRDVRTALELEPTPSACRAFGGCPHIERCNLTNAQKMKGYLKMASLKERLKKEVNTPAKEEAPASEGTPTSVESPFRKRVAARAAAPITDVLPPKEEAPKQKGEVGPPPVVATTPGPGTTAPRESVASTSAPDRLGAQLLIGCIDRGSGAVGWEEAFAAEIAEVQETFKVPHWRLAEFGKGPAAVAAAILARTESLAMTQQQVWCSKDIDGVILSAMERRFMSIVVAL